MNTKMKILIIRNYPSFMDVEHNTYNIQEIGLAKALIRKGHSCDIVFWAKDEEKVVDYIFDDNKHIKVYYRKGRNILKNAIYNNIDDLIKNYDIIQPCEYNQLQAWLLARKYPNKTVIYHGPYYSSFNKGYNTMCKFTDRLVLGTYKKKNTPFIVKSNLSANFLLQKGIKNVTVAGVGVDLDAFRVNNDDKIPEKVEAIDSIDAEIKLLYIGRLEPRRNIPFLFDVLKGVRNKGINAVLVVIGTGDSQYKNDVFNYADKIGVSNSIYYIDKLEQKYLSCVYGRCDVFILPTYYEIFGMVLLEAMYFGKIAVTTENGGSDMLISNGNDGIVIEEFDVNKWVDNIIENKDNPNIGKNAAVKITDQFTWDCLANKFIDIYKRVKNESFNG